MCTYPWPFADELAIWDELGVRQVGVSTAKLDAYGRDWAVTALQERSIKVTTITTRHFDLSNSSTWAQTQGQVVDAIDLATTTTPDQLLALDEALAKLAEEDGAAAKLVQLRYFAGLTVDEAGKAMGISTATAYRHWNYARAWLHSELGGMADS